jgi:hypothetical protein
MDGSFLTRKIGPLATWIWMALVLLVVLGFSLWQRNKQTTAAAMTTTSVPDQTPPYVIQNFITDTDDTPAAPPVGGRPGPPPVHGGPPPPGGGTPPPNPPPYTGQWVTLAKYTAKNPPWNSTLWGIAKQLLGAGKRWGDIWNASQNAQLKSRRKDPKNLQPGDRVWVPSK